jgi:glycosyltransferase involved in cell wall biosynthesis
LKKILILSYFFPPANFAGSYRVYSWAKYLHLFGIYPVIVTRRWNPNQSDLTDPVQNNTPAIEKGDGYEVHYVPYRQSLRDKLHTRYGDRRYRFVRKCLSFFELIFQNFSYRAVPYHNLKDYASGYLRQQHDVCSIVVSGRPWQLFNFARLLSREHGIPWIADYRDEWTTHQWVNESTRLERFMKRFEKTSEYKWLQTSAGFITCSDYLVERIGAFVQKKGIVVYNGFDETETLPKKTTGSDEIEILYNGTLYPTQKIEIFIEGFRQAIQQGCKARLIFAGLSSDPQQVERVKTAAGEHLSYVMISDRLPPAEFRQLLQRCDLFLMVDYSDKKGIYSAKIFDYISGGKPIILCPSAHDVVEELVKETATGIICSTAEEACRLLLNFAEEKKRTLKIGFTPKADVIENYSRKKQTQKLAEAIARLC